MSAFFRVRVTCSRAPRVFAMAHRPPPPVPPRQTMPPPGFSADVATNHGLSSPHLHQLQPPAIHNASTPQQRQSACVSQDSGFASLDVFASARRPNTIAQVSPVTFANSPCLNQACAPNINNTLYSNFGRAVENSAQQVYHSAHAAHAAQGYILGSVPLRAASAPPQPVYSAQQQFRAFQEMPPSFVASGFHVTTPSSSFNQSATDAASAPPPGNVVPAALLGHPASADSEDFSSDDLRLRNFNRLPSLPDFMENSPEYWFRLIETIFRHARLNDSERFVCLIKALAHQERLLSDILAWPEASDNYERAKSTILQRLGRSTEDRIRKVLSEENIGTSTPSQLWRRLRDIASPEAISDATLRVIWLDKLPAFVSMEISNAPRTSVEQTLENADRIFENFNRVGGMQGLLCSDSGIRFTPAGRGRGRGRGLSFFVQDTSNAPGKKDNKTAANNNNNNSSHSNRRPGSHSGKKVQFIDETPPRMPPASPEWFQDPPPLPSSPPLSTELPLSHQFCHFHYRFGASARKCRPPCNHPNARRS